ncbi:hypothetical protein DNTS_014563 [Danionella cerebrum]|uniref:Teneurin N-terminal domain-containing protein n=1 Tax=Danionella cerebrum TaxID=2873325 RepID=A0A553MQ05_9TELE|nr:hypothetical protein DNTS_014563 [Danionella translucida]
MTVHPSSSLTSLSPSPSLSTTLICQNEELAGFPQSLSPPATIITISPLNMSKHAAQRDSLEQVSPRHRSQNSVGVQERPNRSMLNLFLAHLLAFSQCAGSTAVAESSRLDPVSRKCPSIKRMCVLKLNFSAYDLSTCGSRTHVNIISVYEDELEHILATMHLRKLAENIRLERNVTLAELGVCEPAIHQKAYCPDIGLLQQGYSLSGASDADSDPEGPISPDRAIQLWGEHALKSRRSSGLSSRENSALTLTDSENDKSDEESGESEKERERARAGKRVDTACASQRITWLSAATAVDADWAPSLPLILAEIAIKFGAGRLGVAGHQSHNASVQQQPECNSNFDAKCRKIRGSPTLHSGAASPESKASTPPSDVQPSLIQFRHLFIYLFYYYSHLFIYLFYYYSHLFIYLFYYYSHLFIYLFYYHSHLFIYLFYYYSHLFIYLFYYHSHLFIYFF